MAFNKTVLASLLGGNLIDDPQANSTPQHDVTGGTGPIHLVRINNVNNAYKVYVKFYDLAAGVTVGTTVPHMIVFAPPNKDVQWNFNGVPFTTGISYACVIEAGTAGTTSPAADVAIAIEAG
jgi:hypothetical protein